MIHHNIYNIYKITINTYHNALRYLSKISKFKFCEIQISYDKQWLSLSLSTYL